MSTPAHPLSVEGIKDRIEAFAPPEYQSERQALYQGLLDIAGGEATRQILHTVVQAHALYLSGSAQNRAGAQRTKAKTYREDRAKLERKLGQLRSHALLRSLDWEIYGPDEWQCPHGRSRRECEQLYEQRERLRFLDNPPLNKYVKKHLASLKRGAGPLRNQEEASFCRPPVLPGPPLAPPKRGRREDEFQDFLVS